MENQEPMFDGIQYKTTDCGAFYEDFQWNRVSASKGRDEAKRILSTLTNCFHCTDCENCVNCTACENSFECEDCHNCVNAIDCKKCFYSNDIKECETCHSITNLNNAKEKVGKTAEHWIPDKLNKNEKIQDHNVNGATLMIETLNEIGSLLKRLYVSSNEWDEIAKMPNDIFTEKAERLKSFLEDLKWVNESNYHFKWLEMASEIDKKLSH